MVAIKKRMQKYLMNTRREINKINCDIFPMKTVK